MADARAAPRTPRQKAAVVAVGRSNAGRRRVQRRAQDGRWVAPKPADHQDDCDCNDCVRADPFCCGKPVDSIEGIRYCAQMKGDCDLHPVRIEAKGADE